MFSPARYLHSVVLSSGAPSELDFLAELSDMSSDDERGTYVWRHPSLLQPGVTERLTSRIERADADLHPAMSTAIAFLWNVRHRYEQQGVRFPIGAGPIEAVWQRVGAGEISMAEAKRRVCAPEFVAALSARYLQAMAHWVGDQAKGGDWRRNLEMVRLTRFAAISASDLVAPLGVHVAIAAAWIDVAKVALGDIPDGGLLMESRALGEGVLERLGADGDPDSRASVYFGLGTLFLDPYFAGASSGHLEDHANAWLHRGALAVDRTSDQPPPMPEPLAALDLAEGFLRQSLGLRKAGDRVYALKALADVLTWRNELSHDVDTRQIVAFCRLAVADLGDDAQPRLRLPLLNHLQYLGVEVDIGEVRPVLQTSPEDLVNEHGGEGAASILLTAIRLILPTEPRTALDAVKRLRPFFAGGTDELRTSALEAELTALADSLVGPLPTRGSLAADVGEMQARAAREGWNGARRAAAMLRLAARASDTDEETLGLQLIEQIGHTSLIVASEHWMLVAWIRTFLQSNMAVNALRTRDWAECANWYAQALSGFLDLGMNDRGLETLLRVRDIVRRADTPIEAPFLRELAPNAARIESLLGDGATEVIQDMVRSAMVALEDHTPSGEAVNLLWQIAKGARLAPVLAAPSRYNPTTDDYLGRLLARIAKLRADLGVEPGVSGRNADVLLDEESVLTAYGGRRSVEGGGATLEEQIVNLEHAFDELVARRMLLSPGVESAAYLSLADVQASLSDRTVLISLYLGSAKDGRVAIYVLYMTNGDVGVSVVPHGFPASVIEMGGLLANPFGQLVERCRRAIMDPPLGRRPVSRDGEEALQTYLPGLLGDVSERLAAFKAEGRDHLCILPHGPFHFFPFHLLGPPGHPLAEDFAVTYLPHLYLLASRPDHVHATPVGTAIGLGFAGDARPGLQPLPEAAPEAREIASLFGRPAVVDEQATEAAFVRALSTSTVVHLATHGRHNVDAPAFQTLYLHPTPETDGRLHAYELLGLDLSGLRLLTLSACETALGRFDRGDNIRGLPASFFIGGVRTLIGTLWTVPDPVSRHFFSRFHRSLHDGASLLDAFVTAQRDTRAHYPQYRDWGAFSLSGSWGDRDVASEEKT